MVGGAGREGETSLVWVESMARRLSKGSCCRLIRRRVLRLSARGSGRSVRFLARAVVAGREDDSEGRRSPGPDPDSPSIRQATEPSSSMRQEQARTGSVVAFRQTSIQLVLPATSVASGHEGQGLFEPHLPPSPTLPPPCRAGTQPDRPSKSQTQPGPLRSTMLGQIAKGTHTKRVARGVAAGRRKKGGSWVKELQGRALANETKQTGQRAADDESQSTPSSFFSGPLVLVSQMVSSRVHERRLIRH